MMSNDLLLLAIPVILCPSVFFLRKQSLLARTVFSLFYICAFILTPHIVRGSVLANYFAVATSFLWICTCIDVLFVRAKPVRERLNPLSYTLDLFATKANVHWTQQARKRLLSLVLKILALWVSVKLVCAYHGLLLVQLFSLFLLLTLPAEAWLLLFNVVFRVPTDDVFIYPFLACSPRDFWSRRWNRLCCHHFHRIAFLPVAAFTHSQAFAGMLVFILSGVMHDYLNWMALGQLSFENTLFFLIHGTACSLQVYFSKRYSALRRVPWVAAWILNGLFFLPTTPLFFAPYIRARFWNHVFSVDCT